jgi:hypothetical protein
MSTEITKAIEKLKKKIEAVPVMVEESCATIATNAQSAAGSGISVRANGNTIVAVGIGNNPPAFAAYREFGTGLAEKPFDAESITSKLPEEWDKYAYSFKTTGTGTLRGGPYLFPAYESERLELIKKIKQSFG